MKGKYKDLTKVTLAIAGVLWLLHSSYGQPTFAQQPDPRSTVGEVSPLIPMQSAEAVHMGLVWKKKSQFPKILFHARFPEYTPNDVADPAVVDAAIAGGALTNGVDDFQNSLRDVLHPSVRMTATPRPILFNCLLTAGS